MSPERLPGSFRDPSGFLFGRNGILYRQVNRSYQSEYDYLLASGLYRELIDEQLLIPHEEITAEPFVDEQGYKVLRPHRIAFISYPYEWCFGQLKAAALLTLQIQRRALAHGMVLKDASAYNVQFHQGKPVLLDTLSFARYREGEPWVAYRQFCQHFLGPLALMQYTDERLGQLSRIHLDGIPVDLTSRLLPARTRLRFGLLTHLHLHARSQMHFSRKPGLSPPRLGMSLLAFKGLMDHLEGTVNSLKWHPSKSAWSDYYTQTNYSAAALERKQHVVAEWLDLLKPRSVWDLGANTGLFSQLAGTRGMLTIAFDADHAAVELHYQACVAASRSSVLPLVMDLTNPSSGLGWHCRERMSLQERGPADTVLALALIHHLAIANNIPLAHLAIFLAEIGRSLIIEFVPKSDLQVQRLLATREDIFTSYTQATFEQVFQRSFIIRQVATIADSKRLLYLMERREEAQ